MFSFLIKHCFVADLMNGFYDIHSHLLPGVDDGSPDRETTYALLESLQALGVKGIYLTPHVINGTYVNASADELRRKFEELSPEVNMDIRLAAEYMLDDGFWKRFEDSPLLFSNAHILVETQLGFLSSVVSEILFKISMQGITPVFAHPERYSLIQEGNSGKIEYIINNKNIALQLNLLSLCGFHGKASQETARKLLEKNAYTFVGTDTHSIQYITAMKECRIPAKYSEHIRRLSDNNREILF